MRRITDFSEILLLDFEFNWQGASHPRLPNPVCGCAYAVRSQEEYRIWMDGKVDKFRNTPPWPHGRDVLFVSFNAIAEESCYMSLGWLLPAFVLDLLIEYRQLRNGILYKKADRRLPKVMEREGLMWIDPENKKAMQQLVLRGGPYNPEERSLIIEYCWTDVHALQLLFPWITDRLPQDLDLSLHRARYTLPVADTETIGIPFNEPMYHAILEKREEITTRVIDRHPAYKGFSIAQDQFASWLMYVWQKYSDNPLYQTKLENWPVTATGKFSVDKDTLQKFSYIPEIAHLRTVNSVVEQLEKPGFEVINGRNYYSILPFKAESGRNATIGCAFTASSWWRGLIRPEPEKALIYCDFSQEEYYIAARLANDLEMQRLYEQGEPYIEFGKLINQWPNGATKQTHPQLRETLKTICLATLYGASYVTIACKLNISVCRARYLLEEHQRRFPRVWKWFREQVALSYGYRSTDTLHGWRLHVGRYVGPRTVRNFPVQGAGGDILRRAHLLLWEAGYGVCAPVHDAFLVEVGIEKLNVAVIEIPAIMQTAGRQLLGEDSILRAKPYVILPGQSAVELIKPEGLPMWECIGEVLGTENGVSTPIGSVQFSP
jgi:DNA polymerase-1